VLVLILPLPAGSGSGGRIFIHRALRSGLGEGPYAILRLI